MQQSARHEDNFVLPSDQRAGGKEMRDEKAKRAPSKTQNCRVALMLARRVSRATLGRRRFFYFTHFLATKWAPALLQSGLIMILTPKR